ncbi:ABC transporter substrate-binding protein [Facklamia miroungae]|uniref:Multiple sugar transport system substrate-binding protein n=1 Tax=Facklamia miroungae TaxID=120956 RepID=A0A1G7UZ23_9LACT|nr:sugar ABC transporter substrate-binding protein [Facklamia miroungae]NKZ30206.1 sugar ABC transporter substrate-binding protein [Facklamia miroungae]SDG52792.1 multiple sugar transport system substrate-binding protein [Facklamia miroungae]
MKKKLKTILAASLFFSTMFAPITSMAQEEKEPVEISFMIPDWGAPSEEMLAAFEEESGIKVNVLPTGWDDIRDKLAIAAASDTVAADVFEVDWSWMGEFTSADWLAPIELEDADEFPAIGQFMVNDTIYAVPYGNDFRVAYYNTKMYEEAGLKEEPKTWDEVIEQAKKIKADGVVEYPVSIPLGAEENLTTSFLWLAYTLSGKVFNDDNTLNEEATLDALKIFKTLVDEELVNPGNVNSSGMDAYGQISTGDTAFMVGPSSYVGRVNDEEQSSVVGQVMPILLPGKETTSEKTVPFQEAVGISPNTENMEAAQTFVKWYTSEETQLELFEVVGALPTRLNILQQLIDENKIENTGAMIELAEMAESPFPNGVPEYYFEMSIEIYNTINKMVTTDQSAEDAVKELVEKVNNIVEEYAE